MIIPAHLSSYLFSKYSKLALYAFDPYFANMGLGLFIFMSGYLLYYNNYSINSLENVFDFYKKKASQNLSSLLVCTRHLCNDILRTCSQVRFRLCIS
nr:hypothetical protein [Methanosarcina horonobensis]